MRKDFLGTGWGFPPQFSKAIGNVRMVSADENIRNSLEIIIGTRVKERFIHPDFGCDVSETLFGPMSTGTRLRMESLIREAIEKYEHRITLDELRTDVDSISEGRIDIILSYTINDTNTRENLVYPYYI